MSFGLVDPYSVPRGTSLKRRREKPKQADVCSYASVQARDPDRSRGVGVEVMEAVEFRSPGTSRADTQGPLSPNRPSRIRRTLL